ncbi:MAG: ABC transporter ATP-binding protein [Halobacteriovoraceae bacterium]|jgi:ABC-type multidrug transport system fused ATPase/permease subunit|nr:ABC transporter ATP-binding protein [Halobacteriovoraceae bacterium]
MHFRFNRRFIPWFVAHTFEFWYFYVGALFSLYMLHHFSSEIPFLAKSLGDLALEGKLAELKIVDFILLAGYILFFRTFSRLLFFYPARIQQRNLRLELVNRIENAFPRNYAHINEGMIFQNLYNDLNRIRGFMGFAFLQVGNIIIAAIIFIPKIREFNSDFLIAFSPLLSCVVLFSGLIFLFQPWVKREMDEYAQVQNFLLESYSAKKTIQNFHAEQDFFNLFNAKSEKELKTFFISTMGRVFSFPLIKIGVGGSLIWAALIVKNNDLAASDLIFFSSFLFLVLEPLMFLSWIGVVTSQGFAGWGRIKELIANLDQKITDKFFNINNSPLAPTLPLWANEITLPLKKGVWNVLVGETGSGKSWLMDRFSELLHLHKIPYSYIHQEPYLYNDTFIGNIFLGQEHTKEKIEQVKLYVKQFGLDVLHDDIDSLLYMELGENGKRVSGGQAKRIALIRSLISDVEYILWDDPFSSVDLILENEIIQRLKRDKNLSKKTFLISSHRLSTIKASDYILFIDKEQGLKASGEREQILNSGSTVDEFFKKQFI